MELVISPGLFVGVARARQASRNVLEESATLILRDVAHLMLHLDERLDEVPSQAREVRLINLGGFAEQSYVLLPLINGRDETVAGLEREYLFQSLYHSRHIPICLPAGHSVLAHHRGGVEHETDVVHGRLVDQQPHGIMTECAIEDELPDVRYEAVHLLGRDTRTLQVHGFGVIQRIGDCRDG